MKILAAELDRFDDLRLAVDHIPTYAELTYSAHRCVAPAPHKIPPARQHRLATWLTQATADRWLRLRVALGRYRADEVREFTLYLARHPSGYASFFVSHDDDKSGCQGLTFTLRLCDGSTVDVVGPYCGSPDTVNRFVRGARLYTRHQILATGIGDPTAYCIDLTERAARRALQLATKARSR